MPRSASDESVDRGPRYPFPRHHEHLASPFRGRASDSADILEKYFLNAVDAPWDIGLSWAKTERLADPLRTKALEERPMSPQDGATKPDKNGGREHQHYHTVIAAFTILHAELGGQRISVPEILALTDATVEA